MIKLALAKLLTTKIAIAAAATAAATAGGVAAVAATGHTDGPQGGPPSVEKTTSDVPSASADPTRESQHSGSANGDAPDAAPSPSLVGLCHAYAVGAGSEHGKALDNPAFTTLITTAGGKDKVDTYCTGLLATPGTGQGQGHSAEPSPPTAANHSTAAHKPETPPSPHPAGAPSTRPSH